MHPQNTRFHPARIVFSSMLAVLLSSLYAAGAAGFLLQIIRFTASTLGFDWSPEELSGTARIALGIGWFALMVPIFAVALFRSFLVSVLWQVLRHGNWVESTQKANRELAAWYRIHRS